jgi:hypothetical protein
VTNRSQLTDRQRHLPDVDLVSNTGADEQLLRHGRAMLLVVRHEAGCHSCIDYVRSLAEAKEELNSWDMDVAVISSHPVAAENTFRYFVDAEHRLAGAMGIEPPFVMVVDQWGDVKELYEAGDSHNFPNADAFIAWARYLATQCPECEGESL